MAVEVFHVNSAGRVGRCLAERGSCPFGGVVEHFRDAEQAVRVADLVNSGEFGDVLNARVWLEQKQCFDEGGVFCNALYNGKTDYGVLLERLGVSPDVVEELGRDCESGCFIMYRGIGDVLDDDDAVMAVEDLFDSLGVDNYERYADFLKDDMDAWKPREVLKYYPIWGSDQVELREVEDEDDTLLEFCQDARGENPDAWRDCLKRFVEDHSRVVECSEGEVRVFVY